MIRIKNLPSRVIGNTRQHSHAVPTLDKLLREVVDPEILRPKVLTDDQDFQKVSTVFLPHYAVHVVGVAVNDADYLVRHVGHAVVSHQPNAVRVSTVNSARLI